MLRLTIRIAILIGPILLLVIGLVQGLLGSRGPILMISNTSGQSGIRPLRAVPSGLYLLDMATNIRLPLGQFTFLHDGPILSPDGTHYAILAARQAHLLERESLIFTQLTETWGASILHLVWSPDSERLAVTLADPVGAPSDVVVIDIDSRNEDNLTETPHQSEILLDWSPDGNSLLFVLPSGGTSTLYLMDSNGQNLRRFNDGFLGRFSPDGRFIASVRRNGLELAEPTGRIRHIFPFSYGFYWSNSGNFLTVIGEDAILIADIEAGTRRTLIGTQQPTGTVIWSPDDSQMAFVLGDDIYMSTPDGSPHNLTETPSFAEYAPVWSPDGTQIAFLRHDQSGSAICNLSLFDSRQTCHLIGTGTAFRAVWFR